MNILHSIEDAEHASSSHSLHMGKAMDECRKVHTKMRYGN
jgi:hypothetical protein